MPALPGEYGSGHRFHRPAYDNAQRDARYPNVKWRCVDGLVHFSAPSSNHARCEMLNGRFGRELLDLVIASTAPLDMPTTCISCLAYPLVWPWPSP